MALRRASQQSQRSVTSFNRSQWRQRVFEPSLGNSSAHFLWQPKSSSEDEDHTPTYSPIRPLFSLNSQIQIRSIHATTNVEKAPITIIMGLGAVSAASYAGSMAVRAYKEYQASLPPEPTEEEKQKMQEQQQEQEQQDTKESANQKTGEASKVKSGTEKRENIFSKWFGVGVQSKYYEGGFDDTMTRKEAALILGVRESSSSKRIKDAHRKLLILNHPDTGGSTYIAGKINEAKELLLKGRRDK